MMDFEERVLRYFQNKEIISERKEENRLLQEEIEHHFKISSEEDQLVIPMPNGEFAVLTKKTFVKDEFDRDTLAQELLIAKDEIKTPFDYSLLTSQGKLTPDMISKHTHTQTEIKLNMRKRKTKPRKKR